MPLERVAELGRETADRAAEPMDLRVRLEVTGEHRRHGAAVRADRTAYRSRVEMVAKVQFKVVSVLGDKRARRCRTLQDPLRANVSPYMVVEQLLSTTPATLAEFLHTLLKTTTNTTAAPTPGQSWTRSIFL